MAGPGDAGAPDPVRRGLLRGELLTREGRGRVKGRTTRLGPWPPGLQAAESSCRQCCGPCEPACPREIVRFHPLDHRLAGEPYLDFTLAGCTFCGECLEACPERHAVTPGSEGRVWGEVHLASDRCLAWNGVLCMSCLGRCDQRALAMDGRRRLVVDQVRCTGCGACVAPCPVGALAVAPGHQARRRGATHST